MYLVVKITVKILKMVDFFYMFIDFLLSYTIVFFQFERRVHCMPGCGKT